MSHDRDAPVLALQEVNASYGKSHVLHGVSFDVQPGEIVALLGRNGSGRSTTAKAIMGLGFLGVFGAVTAGVFHWLITSNDFSRKVYKRMSLVQYATLQFFMISMMLLPLKIVLRLVFTLKYILVTPWLNI